MDKRESRPKQGWENQTEQRREGIILFLKNHFEKAQDQRQHYDEMNELHISGHNFEVMTKIPKGTAKINEVNILFENDEPTQIHAVFDSEGKGHNLDVYLQGKALEDYLAMQ